MATKRTAQQVLRAIEKEKYRVVGLGRQVTNLGDNKQTVKNPEVPIPRGLVVPLVVDDTAARQASIRELENRLETYRTREARRPGLWTQEIRDCGRMLTRLRDGRSLTRHDRGLPA